MNYLKKEKSCSRILPHSFLVGGKNRGGSFSMFEIALDPQNDRVSVTDRSPCVTPGASVDSVEENTV